MSNGIDLITLALARKGGGGSDTAKELIVTATVATDNTVTTDKTYTDIDNAYASNKNIRILATLNSPRRVVEFNSIIKQGTSYIFGTYENNAYLKITIAFNASTFAKVTSQNLTAGTNITIQNNVISSHQETAKNPEALTFGDETYDGSVPKQITAEKIGAATEDFVNSSIATNTAFFKGTFTSISALPTTGVTNNDYAFIVVYEELEPSTVKQYDRYKYSTEIDEETGEVVGWAYEYTLNNSSFTADEWATIQSGLKDTDKTQIATNTSAIADIVANMPDSPEDVNAQPKSLIIDADSDGESVTISDSRYVSGGTVNYLQLYTDSMAAFNGGTDVVIRITVGGEVVLDLKCNCFNGYELIFEGHNVAAVIIVTMNSSSVDLVTIYNIEPAESLESAEDGDLTTAKAQKSYFQKKIDSSNMLPYSYISGTPTIPTVPSNIIKGYDSNGSAKAYNIQVVTALPTSPSATTIYLVTG